jgi:DNA mismatch repair protein MutS2
MVEQTSSELQRDAEAVRQLLVQTEAELERGRTQRAAERLQKALERRKQIESRRPAPRQQPKRAPAPGGIAPEAIEAGDLVWIRGYDRYGEALSAPDERGEVELHLGPLRGRVGLSQVERVQRPHRREQASPGPGAVAISGVDTPPPEMELRGQTVDEALPTVDQYLDRAYRAQLPWVRIVHGKGTGALRREVRDMLSKHPLVKSYEQAKREEGGEGVTVAYLAE